MGLRKLNDFEVPTHPTDKHVGLTACARAGAEQEMKALLPAMLHCMVTQNAAGE